MADFPGALDAPKGIIHGESGIGLLSGSGAPGGAGGFPDAAGPGTSYTDTLNHALYLKVATGAGTDKWTRIQTQQDADAAAAGRKWRPAARLKVDDTFADLAAAQTAVNDTGTGIQGVTDLVDGQRLLLLNITGANANIFTINGTPGAGATLVEDPNDADAADTLRIMEGDAAGQEWTHNGTEWVISNAGNLAEEGFIRAFVGKDGEGSEAPSFPTNHVVVDGDSLETALGKLDGEIGAAISGQQARTTGAVSDQAVNLNILALDTAIGADYSMSYYLDSSLSVTANLNAVVNIIGDASTISPAARTYGQVFNSGHGSRFASNVDQLDEAIGADPTSINFIGVNSSVNANLSSLDVQVALARTEAKVTGITVAQVVDEVLVDDVRSCQWMVTAEDGTGNTIMWSVTAVHNGTATGDASEVDFTALRNSVGSIAGADIVCTLNGTGNAQTMQVQVEANVAVTATATRTSHRVQ